MNYMGMPNPNSFMNLNAPNLEEIINPFKEKIKKLEEEIMTKYLEIAQLKYQMMQMNSNPINQMNMMYNPNFPMNNPMFQMGNQMNINDNMENPKESKKKKFKRLNLKFKIEDSDNDIVIQSRSDDKIEEPIRRFCVKSGLEQEDLKFIIIGDKKAKMDSTVEENGIFNDKLYYILVKKKSEYDAFEEKNDYEYEEETDKNIETENNNYNIKILGEKIKLIVHKPGNDVEIEIGKDNTFKDAVITYGQKEKIAISKIEKNNVFIFNSRTLDLKSNKTLKEIGLKNGSKILSVSTDNVIGA